MTTQLTESETEQQYRFHIENARDGLATPINGDKHYHESVDALQTAVTEVTAALEVLKANYDETGLQHYNDILSELENRVLEPLSDALGFARTQQYTVEQTGKEANTYLIDGNGMVVAVEKRLENLVSAVRNDEAPPKQP